jgi:hypothetical protein
MPDPQKFCSIRLGSADAVIRVRLARALGDGESITLTLILQDLLRLEELIAVSEATIGPGGQQAELTVQSEAKGLAIAYSIEGFARAALRWRGAFSGSIDATAQFALVGAAHPFPQLAFTFSKVIAPPPAPPPTPFVPHAWILGRGRPSVAPPG